MYLNNKGFAISGFLYSSLILFLTLMLGILVILSTRKTLLDSMKKETMDDLGQIEEIVYDINSYSIDDMLLFYDAITNIEKINNNELANNIFEDLSGNGYNGSLVNFEFNETSGWTDQGLRFDGIDSGISLGNQLLDLFKNSVTIEVIVGFDELNERDIIFGNFSEANCVNWEKHTLNNARVYWDYGSTEYFVNNVYNNTIPKLLTFILEKETGKVSLWVNSDKIGEHEDPLYQSYNYDWANGWIGRDSRTGVTVLKGEISAVRIYNRPLADNEIRYHYFVDKKRYGI